jgi:hypothetical protein
MGVDEGFDIYPALKSSCQPLYDEFLIEILQKYEDAVHPVTGETLIRIVGEPGAEDAHIYFQFGEGAIIPYRCEYFLRFSSKLVRHDPEVAKYLREVYMIAKEYFCDIEYWLEGGQSYTYHASETAPHDWRDVHKARQKLKKHEGAYQTFGVKEALQALQNERPNLPYLYKNVSSSPPPPSPSRVSSLSFFEFVIEIRLKIYSELLIHSEPIVFVADYGPPSPPLFRNQRAGLCPALLRANKKVYSEASSLLYSNNRFRFPDIFISTPCPTTSPHIAPFLHQIGSQASLIRHVCISFPTFDDIRHDRAMLHEAHIKNLELIRDTCTSLTTLELLLPPDSANYAFDDSPITAEALGLLDTRFKAILSLKTIIVNFQVYDAEDRSDDRIKMRDRGWTVEVTKLPKKVWFSDDGRVKFDNEEECEAYDHEQLLFQWRREEEEEEKQWTEEYYQRRHDPYWKNDSDYD